MTFDIYSLFIMFLAPVFMILVFLSYFWVEKHIPGWFPDSYFRRRYKIRALVFASAIMLIYIFTLVSATNVSYEYGQIDAMNGVYKIKKVTNVSYERITK